MLVSLLNHKFVIKKKEKKTTTTTAATTTTAIITTVTTTTTATTPSLPLQLFTFFFIHLFMGIVSVLRTLFVFFLGTGAFLYILY